MQHVSRSTRYTHFCTAQNALFLLCKNWHCQSFRQIVYRSSSNLNLSDLEKKIIKILETKVRPAVARDGGDIKFKDFKDGKVIVELQGSCSGCPSSTLTLKKGVQNLLCHYVPEVKEVEAIWKKIYFQVYQKKILSHVKHQDQRFPEQLVKR